MKKHSEYFVWSFFALSFGFILLFGTFYFLGGVDISFDFLSVRGGDAASLSSGVLNDREKEEPKVLAFPEAEGLAYYSRDKYEFPYINADAFLVADIDTGQIIKAKNEEEIHPIASVTKLMTALVSLEEMSQYEKTTISENAVATYGMAGSLYEGEEILIKQLIYPLLLESSNDAAVALAEHAGMDNFVSLMDKKAESLGLLSTYYEEPSGLSEKNVSTAEDLFHLAQYIYQSRRSIFNTTQKRAYDRWYSNNSFVNNKYFIGGKNGYTPEAGRTAVALLSLPLSDLKDRRIAVVLLDSSARERDMARIINWLKGDVFYGENPKPKEEEKVTSLVFVGDIMMDRGVENSVSLNGGDFSFLFEKADFLKEADVSFGNLEGPISDKGKNMGSSNSFRFEPKSLGALIEAGLDVLSVANNHAGDWGRTAFEDSLRRLKEGNIVAVGGGLNSEDAVRVKIVEKNGIKLGFLGFSDVGPNWMKAEEDKPGVSIAGDDLGFLVGQAAKQVDILVVSFHFGEEYKDMSNDRQKYLAHLAVDNGAKIVVGHHPHVVQEVENYKGTVIAYSLGNFIFDQNFSEGTMTGLAFEIYLSGSDILSTEQKQIKISKSFQPSLAE